jgi:metallo-beta-lactamase family protein
MQLISHGAAGFTTGSLHLLEINKKKILLDCGLREGKREEAYNFNKTFPFDPASIDAVILSHAHIDHSGNLPNLCQQGFTGNIYTTFATRDLAGIMLQDSAKVQASDIAFVNKRRARQQLPLFHPLYDAIAAEKSLRQFVTIDYARPLPVCDGVIVTFFDAGHLLGSAQVLLELREGSRKLRFLFSGDVGRGNNDILRDPATVSGADFLLMESTYGGREHEDKESAQQVLLQAVRRALEQKGKLLIPSFAVGRAQHIVYLLHKLHDAGQIPSIPIYVDSPMAVNATEIHRLHPECFNEATYQFLFEKRNPFGWEDVTYIRHVDDSMKLNELRDAAIIISSSGMCEAGRILHHLRNSLPDPRTTLLFVGYCADHTLGARLLAGAKEVKVFGEPVAVNATVMRVDTFSGHADHSELVEYARRSVKPGGTIRLVHGEPDNAQALCDALKEKKIGRQVSVARLGVSISL